MTRNAHASLLLGHCPADRVGASGRSVCSARLPVFDNNLKQRPSSRRNSNV